MSSRRQRPAESFVGLFAGYVIILFCFTIHIVGFLVWHTTISALSNTSLLFTVFVQSIFHYLFIAALWSYIKVIITNGGFPDDSCRVEPDRWCTKCEVGKDIRTHHCSVCNQCVLEMDHHCIWLSRCVGQRNRKYFLLFIIYEAFMNLFVALTLGYIFFFRNEVIFVFGGYFSSGLLLLLTTTMAACLIPFSGYHLWLVSRGLTTLEHISFGSAHKRVGSSVEQRFTEESSFNVWSFPKVYTSSKGDSC
ncbi:hypothetical protein GEMRC1_008410 [Eukaryota sp. GEM-RC1]